MVSLQLVIPSEALPLTWLRIADVPMTIKNPMPLPALPPPVSRSLPAFPSLALLLLAPVPLPLPASGAPQQRRADDAAPAGLSFSGPPPSGPPPSGSAPAGPPPSGAPAEATGRPSGSAPAGPPSSGSAPAGPPPSGTPQQKRAGDVNSAAPPPPPSGSGSAEATERALRLCSQEEWRQPPLTSSARIRPDTTTVHRSTVHNQITSLQ
ncbi:hypothetical protein L198_05565 [Cryptococcus wingfieldii CBS 7118]|uniref:Uncharacterized protein n=1 Tax=Cryptococcus wingfieldii CBS 7118 TaxID=1295528 RepID=A0A1E3IVX3_9TREE|nr:hypothetical protein L198_05565 [Cryptococcus wingfieldii CBS 7118]ODN92770.1 hypothetical protein L198_05565 [Cryptococcus wingfieldii CBS 7118]